ncbi:RES family NAD+ phosphorylase [Escherichia coli]|uniref:RES domain-containing protein n=1 Tax=Escherichia coli TaxID=562 RepID=A0A6D0K1U4_ECOLX|nr:RES family NAD+ phosphorylase [Escherichia coli]EER3651979.1 RES family NAD+ phosphorylase [Escherichia coli]EES0941894.1 RES family NAD+ phosphorylase [Escherichia coli]EES2037998.1 RES family NAD+ phosphorylase [Escherichia coli]EET2684712.1 RES family NAD+ phosphorylase [Escherichia coli]EEU1995876.1 RES family NAD+ phosphorylase [Escherichia coli]
MEKNVKVIELSSLDHFRNDLLANSTPKSVEAHLSWYLKSFGGLNFSFGYDRPIIRARRCSNADGYGNISQLLSPPPELTTIGRMNDEGKPMLYASYHIGTALAEINAKDGDIVQIIQLELPKNAHSGIRCLAIGEIYNAYHGITTISPILSDEVRKLITRLGAKDIHGLMSFLYMDALSAELLNDVLASKNNYIYSRTLSRLLLEKHKDIDGIVFPSAKIKGTSNITLRPESILNKTEIVSNMVIRISKIYPYGICDFKVLKRAKGHKLDGDVIW